MNEKHVTITLNITSYIASPYWPERNEIINITKESGMSRARSDANRAKALEEHLRKKGMTVDDYNRLRALAERPWHKNDDGQIIIPAWRILSMIVQASGTLRSASRPCDPANVKAYIRATDFVTDKREADRVWERFAVVTGGAGAKLSNQRAFRSDELIENATAVGALSYSPQFVSGERLMDAVKLAGYSVGIGASRSQGHGRFIVTQWEEN